MWLRCSVAMPPQATKHSLQKGCRQRQPESTSCSIDQARSRRCRVGSPDGRGAGTDPGRGGGRGLRSRKSTGLVPGHRQVTRWATDDPATRQPSLGRGARQEDPRLRGLGRKRARHLYQWPRDRRRGINSAPLAKIKRAVHKGTSLHVFQAGIQARAIYDRHGFTITETTGGAQYSSASLPNLTPGGDPV